MKKILVLLMAIALIVPMLAACGSDNNEAPEPRNNNTDNPEVTAADTSAQQDEPWPDPTPEDAFEFSSGTITKYVGNHAVVRVPVRIGGEVVTAIGEGAFEENKVITELYLPSVVKQIGDSAFYFASNLTVAELGQVEEIGSNAFNMTRLKTITMSPVLRTIGERGFSLYAHAGSEEPIVDVVIPASVTYIGERAFSTDWFRSFTFEGETLPEMGNDALSGARSWTTVFVHDSYTEDQALDVMTALYAAGMSSSATVQRMNGTELFADYSAYFEYDFVGGRGARITKYIGDSDTLVIPLTIGGEPVYRIGPNAFEGNETIRFVVLPEQLEIIAEYVFRDCINLESINIPDSVHTLGVEAFNGTTSLRFASLSVEEIPYGAFMKSGIESLVIGDGTTRIGSSAFRNCENLTNVVMGKNVKEVGYEAFDNCFSLKAIDFLPEGLEIIGDYAFSNNYSVSEIRVPEGVKTIGNFAFRYAGRMLHMEDEWRQILANLGSVAVFVVKDPETELGDLLVRDEEFPKWVSIYLPSTIESMGWGVFDGVDIDGLHLPPGTREVSQLPNFDDTFYDVCCVIYIYVDDATTQPQIDAFSAFFMSDEDIQRASGHHANDRVGNLVTKYTGLHTFYTKG